MTQQDYEELKAEVKKTMMAELFKTKKNLVNYEKDIYDYAFDRAYALGKQTEIITQEEIEKAAGKFADEIRIPTSITGVMIPLLHDIAKSSYLQGAQDFLGKQEKDADTVIQGWVAVDDDGDLFLYRTKPARDEVSGMWMSGECPLDVGLNLFPDLTWHNDPEPVEIIIKRKNKGLPDLGDDNILDLPNEQWRPVVGYEGLYEVSNLGRVKSLPRYSFRNNGIVQRIYGRLIHLRKDSHTGYYRVALSKDGSHKFVGVHRLVAQAFIPNPDNLPIINHIDWDRTNNVVILDNDGNVIKSNLEWCTQKHNANHVEWEKTKRVKPIRQLDLNGNVIATFISSAEASRQTGISRAMICACLNHYYKNTKCPYKWERI